jgi:hypothetical protein
MYMSSNKYHSQYGIEEYVSRFYGMHGFFLEIGCWDGELISQTAWLERERGWRGLCVDPFARNFEARTCRVCRKAISGQPSAPSREFVKVSIDRRDGGDVSYFSGFRDTLSRHWSVISQHCDYEIVRVETITIEELYKVYNLPAYIEFLSVDVEGAEVEIFESIDFARWHYGLIMFEHNEDEKAKRRIGELLLENGYQLLAELGCDDVYVSSHLERERL